MAEVITVHACLLLTPPSSQRGRRRARLGLSRLSLEELFQALLPGVCQATAEAEPLEAWERQVLEKLLQDMLKGLDIRLGGKEASRLLGFDRSCGRLDAKPTSPSTDDSARTGGKLG